MNPTSNTKMKRTLALLVLLPVLFLIGCNRALELKTPLEPDERVAKDDVVSADGKSVGLVKKVTTDGNERIALLVITDMSVVEQKMHVGVVRIRESEKISLRTDGVYA